MSKSKSALDGFFWLQNARKTVIGFGGAYEAPLDPIVGWGGAPRSHTPPPRRLRCLGPDVSLLNSFRCRWRHEDQRDRWLQVKIQYYPAKSITDRWTVRQGRFSNWFNDSQLTKEKLNDKQMKDIICSCDTSEIHHLLFYIYTSSQY